MKTFIEWLRESKLNEGNINNALCVALESTVKTLKIQIKREDEKAAKKSIESIRQILDDIEKKSITENK